MDLSRKLKINGKPVKVVCNQMLFDPADLDLGVPWKPLQEEEEKKELQKCECGAQAIGIQRFMPGHSDYCPVHEDRTPISG